VSISSLAFASTWAFTASGTDGLAGFGGE